jgi:hypothetical protein
LVILKHGQLEGQGIAKVWGHRPRWRRRSPMVFPVDHARISQTEFVHN